MREFRKYRDRVLKDADVRAGYEEQAFVARLGELMRQIREQAKFSQEKWAKMTGLSQADVSRLETGLGKKGPTFDTLVRWVHARKMKLVIQALPKGRRGKASTARASDDHFRLVI